MSISGSEISILIQLSKWFLGMAGATCLGKTELKVFLLNSAFFSLWRRIKAGVHLPLHPQSPLLTTHDLSPCSVHIFALGSLRFLKNCLIHQWQTEFNLGCVLPYSDSLKSWNYLHMENNGQSRTLLSRPGDRGFKFLLSFLGSLSTSTRGQSGESFTPVRSPLLKSSFNHWIRCGPWFFLNWKTKSNITHAYVCVCTYTHTHIHTLSTESTEYKF